MTKVRILIRSSFTYVYGSKVSYKRCGDGFDLDPSLPEQLEELKFVLASENLKKGRIYIDENVIYDYNNKLGYFADKSSKSTKSKAKPVVEKVEEPKKVEKEPEVVVVEETASEEKEVEKLEEPIVKEKEVVKEVVETSKPTLNKRSKTSKYKVEE